MIQNVKRYIPLLFLTFAILILYLFGWHKNLNLALIETKREQLFLWTKEYPVTTFLSFFLVYVLSICLVIPDSTILSLAAGMVYPLPIATILISASEALGALFFFLIIQYAFSTYKIKKHASSFDWIRKRYEQSPISYLLFFRLSHLLPFWLINILAVGFKTHPWTFLWSTFIGVLPLSFLLAEAGRSLEIALQNHTVFSFDTTLTLSTKLILIAISLVALFPIFLRAITSRKIKKN